MRKGTAATLSECSQKPCICNKKVKVKIKLKDGKEREIQHETFAKPPTSAADSLNSNSMLTIEEISVNSL